MIYTPIFVMAMNYIIKVDMRNVYKYLIIYTTQTMSIQQENELLCAHNY